MHFGDQCSGAILLRVDLSWGKLRTIEMVTWDQWDLGWSYIGWLMISVLDIFPLKTWTKSLFRFQEIMIMNHILPNLPSIIHLVNKICGRCVKQDLSSCKGTNVEMWVSWRYVRARRCLQQNSRAIFRSSMQFKKLFYNGGKDTSRFEFRSFKICVTRLSATGWLAKLVLISWKCMKI